MWRLLLRRFILFLCLTPIPALCQGHTIRIAVPLLPSGTRGISVSDARAHLLKALNQHKRNKKMPFSVQAIPLTHEWGSNALGEARDKNCEFALSIQVRDLRTDSVMSNAGGGGMDYVPLFRAVIEYKVIRVIDGAAFAVGSAEDSDSNSLDSAAELAISRTVGMALADIVKGGNVPHPAVADKQGREEEFQQVFQVASIGARPCIWLPDNIPHADALKEICDYAMSLTERMPNFICDQQASRFRGHNAVPFDLITALVRYEDGKESYDEIKLDGKPAPDAITKSPGLWSTGQFGSNLRAIFDPRNQPLFTFDKEGAVEGRPAWIFHYRIARQNDPLWRLHGENAVLAPPYEGELWIDQKTRQLRRFSSVATAIPPEFPMSAAELEINYADVAFADGSSSVLPSEFTVTTAYRKEERTRNRVQFRSCHKFRARTQILLNVPKAAPGLASTALESEAAVAERERAENESLYAILREQAVREDRAQDDAQNVEQLNLATRDALARLARLEKERQRNAAILAASANRPQPAAPESGTIFKVSVRLVPVTVVLRDPKGSAVGALRQEDFALFDNGTPQTIRSFSVEGVRSGEEARSPAKPEADHAAGPVNGNLATLPERYVAYLFDDLRISFEDLASAREAAKHRLDGLRPQDWVGVFTTSGQVVLDFTSDRKFLLQALDALRPHPIQRGVLCPQISHYMADLIINQDDREALGVATRDAASCSFGGMATSGPELERAEQIAKSTALEVLSASSAESQSTLGVLQSLIRRTAGVPGARTIVLISPGFLTLSPEIRQGISELIDRALESQIVVNTLDVRGLYTPVAAPNQAHPSNPVVRSGYNRDEALAKSDVLANLAYSTGGIFFHNNNDLNEGFRRTAEAPEYVYVLGFSPQKLDGKYHKLRVKLKTQAKLSIQAREGYYALKPATTR